VTSFFAQQHPVVMGPGSARALTALRAAGALVRDDSGR
jgi:hypothetical protein